MHMHGMCDSCVQPAPAYKRATTPVRLLPLPLLQPPVTTAATCHNSSSPSLPQPPVPWAGGSSACAGLKGSGSARVRVRGCPAAQASGTPGAPGVGTPGGVVASGSRRGAGAVTANPRGARASGNGSGGAGSANRGGAGCGHSRHNSWHTRHTFWLCVDQDRCTDVLCCVPAPDCSHYDDHHDYDDYHTASTGPVQSPAAAAMHGPNQNLSTKPGSYKLMTSRRYPDQTRRRKAAKLQNKQPPADDDAAAANGGAKLRR